MKFGLFSLMTLRDHPDGARGVMADTRQMVEQAEEAGFDIAWFAEHHFANYSMSPSPLMMAAHAAGWTRRIKLGAGVIVLPLYNPLRVAQEIAMLDIQSDGRAVVGIGTGYQQFEFTRFGVPIEEKVEIFLEYWDVVEMALTQGVVEHHGKYISVPKTTFAVRPMQQPMPPVYFVSSQVPILRRFKDTDAVSWIAASTLGSPVLYKMADALNQNWRVAGCDPATKPLAIMQYINITDSKAEALEAGERARYVGRMAHHLRVGELPMDGTLIRDEPFAGEGTIEDYARNTIVGDPHHVAARMVEDIRRLNPSHYACNFQFGCMPLERASRSLQRFRAEVVPLIERELGPVASLGEVARVPHAAQ
ncbi:LLM class flavin-dependent oxidoreductase [Labrys monachus]|uniref:Alkanesulfonate monooxygenase SsuD/methylene tetrahydromethanopterin reductase-like flavin-dependent oxidoreductase (Luciferase family) n=1 Tax=Labrys monachus TaxID=217067 RepID=A0ABU0FJV9_9HYPH|nr:LLM class flavin-dependent oxidoreductase [Labrys monachus]MDQ0394899.1 alkanesulfonate monooxygenase SsuD/methylene tetrahydromethanopterin reductase-like flavin-dependent oxidoreductase (luciferase family) [Labrys monachus]